MQREKNLRALILTASLCLLLVGCAENGELGLKNHPLDCASGIVHSDCLPGTLGYALYNNQPGAQEAAQIRAASQQAAQAQYQAQQQRNYEIQMENIRANQYRAPTTTNCHTDNYGNTNCSTY